ncbi:hypothetical protein [Micromonospora sp. NPDC050276]|uniref:hypothetical protein n=1 Tax=Micromonospora sp. NPDC050276 TaxID=3364278 RepID=UPI0037AE57B4
MASLAGLGSDRDLHPGMGYELGVRARLVGLNHNHQTRAGGGEQVDVTGLGVQRIRDDQNILQRSELGGYLIEQGCERQDFVEFVAICT